MLKLTAFISLMVGMPLTAQANTVISLASTTCSGAMSISSLAGASLSCTGNLSLNGGWINSDASILIHADGDLLLENLYLTAPEISLSSLSGSLHMASSVDIQTGQNQIHTAPVFVNLFPGKQIIDWKPFDITLNPGASIQFNMPSSYNGVVESVTDAGQVVIKGNGIKLTSAVLNTPTSVMSVPEANTGAMLLLGLGLLALKRKFV